jgi:asparagine synthase (glutamine-hydrolysing)
MCRIAGIVSREGRNDEAGLRRMVESVARGGPDDAGFYFDDRVSFGHRRLAIIDLSAGGHQPMSMGSELIISFNGEIYNYLELRKELEKLGAIFATSSDTEVILQAYHRWGTASFDRLEGMFAFSILDKRANTLFLARDHVGVKPLYYFLDDNEIIFASEIRAFKALRDWKVNEKWKILFLAFGSVPHPLTTLEDVYQLNPGCYLELKLSDWSNQTKPYVNFTTIDQTIHQHAEALKMMQFAVRKSVRKNLIADTPIGVYLSGGIDSSLLTLLADYFQEGIKTVSVNFDEKAYDEYPFQRLVLEKTRNVQHTSYRISERMFWENLDEIWSAMDQPSIDAVNTYFISKCARADGLKVVLSGVGADEVFGGYSSTSRIYWLSWIRHAPFKKLISGLLGVFRKAYRRLIFLQIPGAIGDYLFLRGIHTPNVIARLLRIPETEVWDVLKELKIEVPQGLTRSEYASFLESRIYMRNQLLKDTDFMSMWHGLEVRVPFLDVELLKKVAQIKPAFRYYSGWPKYLLTAPNQNILPPEITFRAKRGFTFPFGLWLRKSPKKFKSLLSSQLLKDPIVTEFEMGNGHWSKVWSLIVLQQYK